MKRLVAGILLLGAGIPASTDSLDAVVAKVMPAIVSIRAESAWGGVVSGTGFIIEETGTVATSLRVVEGAQRIAIELLNGDVYDRITVVSFDQQRDLAILKFTGFGLSTVEFAAGEVAVEQAVFAVGNPRGAHELIGTNSPLFDGTDETTLSGTWRSLTSSTRKELRQDGTFLTGFYSNDPDSVSYDLVLQEDGHYRGQVKAALTIYGHSDQWREWESRVCVFETKIVLRAVTPNRIEGRIHGYEDPPGDDRSADKNTCLGPEPLRWIDFVWVRVE